MPEFGTRIDWPLEQNFWQGEFEGRDFGSGVSVIFNNWAHAGGGAALHSHPYPETFILRAGTVIFQIAGREVVARRGQILVVPPHTPHSFTNAGPDPIDMIDIHASSTFQTQWLTG